MKIIENVCPCTQILCTKFHHYFTDCCDNALKPHTERPRTFWLWGESANRCTTMPTISSCSFAKTYSIQLFDKFTEPISSVGISGLILSHENNKTLTCMVVYHKNLYNTTSVILKMLIHYLNHIFFTTYTKKMSWFIIENRKKGCLQDL